MERVMKRPELARELAQRTGFYIKNMEQVLDALDDVIVENMSTATKDEPSEIRLSLGFTLGGRYSPKREVRDPRNGNMVMTPAKYIPYAKFSPAFRKKINKK
jgi:nucleoid DNA-binding protein